MFKLWVKLNGKQIIYFCFEFWKKLHLLVLKLVDWPLQDFWKIMILTGLGISLMFIIKSCLTLKTISIQKEHTTKSTITVEMNE